MNGLVGAMLTKDSYTEKGAITHSTSKSALLDLFFLAGASRRLTENEIHGLLAKAYDEDRLKTLKIIFWAGDIRQGAGERRFFTIALTWLNKNHAEDIMKNINLIPEFSRWDVIFDLATENKDLFNYICNTLKDKEDKNRPLLCKWLPRKSKVKDKKGNTRVLHNKIANLIRKELKLTPKEYRQMLTEGCKVVEQQMCKKEWDKITYSAVPSVAMNKYRASWYRNDKERFEGYLEKVKSGKSKINASAIFPNDIIKSNIVDSWHDFELTTSQKAQWNALPNWLEGKESKVLPVCDVSGSMFPMAITVSLGLGLYISERNTGIFKDAFITFSENPKMQYLKGDIEDRLNQLCSADWGMTTDLEKVFVELLRKAKEANLSQEQMPEVILIISDMEFDEASQEDKTNYENIRSLYAESNYKLPKIVFWNVCGRLGNFPVNKTDLDVALVSGYSPSIMEIILNADFEKFSPMYLMNSTIEKDRYSTIS